MKCIYKLASSLSKNRILYYFIVVIICTVLTALSFFSERVVVYLVFWTHNIFEHRQNSIHWIVFSFIQPKRMYLWFIGIRNSRQSILNIWFWWNLLGTIIVQLLRSVHWQISIFRSPSYFSPERLHASNHGIYKPSRKILIGSL